MKLYYYKNTHGNFGDDINGWLWEELIPGVWDGDDDIMVSGIGTIISESMPFSPRWVIMSSGTGYAPVPDSMKHSRWNIICVRGPLTVKLLGLEADKAVTDGAILISLLPRYQPAPENERRDIVFMPHHAQTLKLGRWKEVCEKAGIVFLDPRGDSKKLVDSIRNAKLVLASAMHAAIIADAVRVPWLPLEITSETSSFKWLDWTLSMELPYHPLTLPASSPLEKWHTKILSILKLDHAFSDLNIEGAMRHSTLLRARDSFGAGLRREMVGKTFGILRSVIKWPVIKHIYGRLCAPHIDRAVIALRHAAIQPPFLSDTDVFVERKNEMKKRLDILAALAGKKEERSPEKILEETVAPQLSPQEETKAAQPRFAERIFNTLLRLSSLAAKLVLTLYMGRYLGLTEMGTYGLITAYVAILVTLLGVRFDYVVSRDIVDAEPLTLACKIRDQIVFYGLNYLALGLFFVLAALGPLKGVNTEIIIFTFLLSVLESFASITSGNFVSLNRPVLANVLFFIRAALWVVPVVAFGAMSPDFRTAGTILFWWMSGVIASLVVTFIAWRHLPWRTVMRMPVDWQWIKTGVKNCFLIWLGVIGATAATYVDRFVVEHYLGRDYVGIASFYGSFVLAIQSLLQSSVFAFSYPKLISHHRQQNTVLFKKEAWTMTGHAVLFTGCVSLAIGTAVPILGRVFHRPEFTHYASTLWLMLLAMWLRSTTEGLYYVLYARHQDRIIWIGGFLMLLPAFACNIIFVPLMGFQGIGYSAIAVAIFLCAWRIYCVACFRPPSTIEAPSCA